MSHIEKCPVCNGTGKVIMRIGNTIDTSGNLTEDNSQYEQTCNNCEGIGKIISYVEYA